MTALKYYRLGWNYETGKGENAFIGSNTGFSFGVLRSPKLRGVVLEFQPIYHYGYSNPAEVQFGAYTVEEQFTFEPLDGTMAYFALGNCTNSDQTSYQIHTCYALSSGEIPTFSMRAEQSGGSESVFSTYIGCHVEECSWEWTEGEPLTCSVKIVAEKFYDNSQDGLTQWATSFDLPPISNTVPYKLDSAGNFTIDGTGHSELAYCKFGVRNKLNKQPAFQSTGQEWKKIDYLGHKEYFLTLGLYMTGSDILGLLRTQKGSNISVKFQRDTHDYIQFDASGCTFLNAYPSMKRYGTSDMVNCDLALQGFDITIYDRISADTGGSTFYMKKA
ncbi:MAG: hypothetical protein JRJ62_01580 [Deltaproteobacteria bacterium]|nr:hypothetical protein [Deltaproteobacteria bacterium]